MSMSAGSTAAAASLTCVGATADAASAAAIASACNQAVEITGERSETTTVYANPDGTQTADIGVAPRYAEVAPGQWVDVDPTLTPNLDGSLSPRAGTLPIRISGGGTGPLVTADRDGRSLSLFWPDPLPVPDVNGSTASYHEVLPGVDLQVIASASSFEERLVVADRTAASHPALTKIGFRTTTSGLSLSANADGTTIATDPAGDVVFAAGTARMWDASGREVAMATSYADSTLAIVPDAAMLADPGTVFPVVIDPSFTAPNNHWTLLRKTNPSTSYWDASNGDINSDDATYGLVRVGLSDWQPTHFVDRSAFYFTTSKAVGTHVTAAVFRLHQLWSGMGCGSAGGAVGLYKVPAISSSTTWNTSWNSSGSGWTTGLGTNSEVHRVGGSGSCAPADVEWNLNSYIGTLGLGTASTVYLGIKGQSETNHNTWKRYDISKVVLSITYNSYPATPDALTIDGKPCGTGANAAWVSTLAGRDPVLKAHITDPDGGLLSGAFTWSSAAGTKTGSQSGVTSGGTAQVSTDDTTFTPGATYSFSAKASDGTDVSKVAGGPCEFATDNAAPAAKPSVASADGRYPEDPNGTLGFRDGVGKTGTFTFSANGVSDAAGYYYGPTDPPATFVAAGSVGGGATGAITPSQPGINDLWVRAVDRAGNLGPSYDYRFWVGAGTSPVARYTFGNPSALGADTGTGTGTLHPLTWAGPASSQPGRISGTSASAYARSTAGTTSAPVLDTTGSFSVAAWVKVNDVSNNYTAVAQDGASNSAFYLQEQFGKWSLSASTADSNTAVDKHALSSVPAVAGVWTHLVGVYDKASGQIRLYVNGAQSGSDNLGPNWAANGATTIGRARYHGVLSDWFNGEIADARIWDRVVDANEIAGLAAPTLTAAWDLDDSGGSTAADSSGYGHPGTLSPTGVTWNVTGHNFNDLGSAKFNGSSGGILSGTPPLLTNQSYTVAAWVRPTALPTYATILGQRGSVNSGALLQYIPNLGWSMSTQVNDAASPPSSLHATSGTAYVQLNTWQHVAGVYDAQAHQLRIYVNGVLRGTATATVSWNSTGPLAVGNELFNSSVISYFTGDIDAVRVYQGAMSDSQIAALAGA
jgi:hypothetical protein